MVSYIECLTLLVSVLGDRKCILVGKLLVDHSTIIHIIDTDSED